MNVAANAPATPVQHGWWSKNWKWATPLILVVVLVGLGLTLGWPYLRPRMHSQYGAAMAEIRQNAVAIDKLGQPIQAVRWLPSGDLTPTTAKLTFEVAGPKGKAQVLTMSRLLDGQWGFAALELTFPDGQRLDLASETRRGDNDMPKFDPNAKQADVKPPDLPVDIQLPDMSQSPDAK